MAKLIDGFYARGAAGPRAPLMCLLHSHAFSRSSSQRPSYSYCTYCVCVRVYVLVYVGTGCMVICTMAWEGEGKPGKARLEIMDLLAGLGWL